MIKKLLCKLKKQHHYSERVQHTQYVNGQTYYKLGKQCKKCGAVKWL